jgi:hypothetical protein
MSSPNPSPTRASASSDQDSAIHCSVSSPIDRDSWYPIEPGVSGVRHPEPGKLLASKVGVYTGRSLPVVMGYE